MESNPGTVRDKKFAVLGGGGSGSAAARLLLKHGAEVFLSDTNTSDDLDKTCETLSQKFGGKFNFELGQHSETLFKYREAIILSPGIGFDIPVLIKARELGIPVYGELELASRFCRNPVIAVTGTNGKSTVVMMLDAIFCAAGRPARTAGNTGDAFSDVVVELEYDETVLLEVSSFQLESIITFSPHSAVILNISADHLYRHKTMDEYSKNKLRIGENQSEDDILIFNHNDPYLQKITAPGRAAQWWFDNQNAVDRGAGVRKDTMCLYENGKEKEIASVHDLPVPGAHNVANALAAAAAAGSSGIGAEDIRSGLLSFKGIEHRLENAGTVRGVVFINDSKATNIDAMIAALTSFKGPVILIAGGEDKGSDLAVANQFLKDRVKNLLLIGEAADRMENAWSGLVPAAAKVKSIQDAVENGFRGARDGDRVLFSPGCASFDMFSSFEERGRVFKHLVNNLYKQQN